MKKLPAMLILASGFVLSACEGVEPPTSWYVDADGDGYGKFDGSVTFSTNQPSGYVSNNTDCDDTVAAINPAATELNDDQVDSDCDGALSKAPFVIGDIGPAGGVVFQTDGTNGLEAAPADQDDGSGAEWGCDGVVVAGADSHSDGTQNTADMLAAACAPAVPGNPLAVNLVADYTLNAYSDWYLPAKDELTALYLQRAVVGGFSSWYYRSSTEYNADWAWRRSFADGSEQHSTKAALFRVRAIRAF